MSVTTTAQTVEVTDVAGFTLTAIEQDTVTGEYVREVRASSNAVTGSDTIVFRLRLRSPTREGIELATPSLTL